MSSLPLALRAGIALLAFFALVAATLVSFDLAYRGMLGIGQSKTATMAGLEAGFIVWIELSMGLILLESRGSSRVLRVVSQMLPSTRVRLAWVSGGILGAFAPIHLALAFLISLKGGHTAATARVSSPVPLDYQADNPALWVLAFLLPFCLVLLTFVLSRALRPIDGGRGGATLSTAAG